MKKVVLAMAIFLFICSLTACDPPSISLDYDELKSNVISVELINYDNPNSKKFTEEPIVFKKLELDKIEVLEILDEKKIDNFLLTLTSEVGFHDAYDEYPIAKKRIYKCNDSPNGIAIILRYSNGDIYMLNGGKEVNLIALYDSQGDVKEHSLMWTRRGDFEKTLVNDYFTAYHYDGYKE